LGGFDEQGSKSSLVDYNFHKPTSINVGTGQHTIGIEVSAARYVGRLYIYVDKNIYADTKLTKTANWQVSWSNSGAGPWTEISVKQVIVSVYDPLNNIYRYEIRFPAPLKHAFYRAINKVPVNASGITDVFVTEIEAYGVDVYP
jgi:hypothetical protein